MLHVNHADLGGGAAVAGFRLHNALSAAGIRSSMLVGAKGSYDDAVTQLRPWRTIRRPVRAALEGLGLNELDGISAYSVRGREDFRASDVVHYHAIHGGYFSYPVMPALTRAKPSAITLHDMWPLTGHCSFSFECQRFTHGCGHCPHPEVFPAIKRDATAIEWRMKDRIWDSSRLTVISPTEWLAGIARRSMLGRFSVEVIPHGIDTDAYAPVDRAAARRALRLPAQDPVILFASTSLADHRKGADLVLPAMEALPGAVRRGCVVALMGDRGPQLSRSLRAAGYMVADFGFVASDHLKAIVYSSADAFVFPTRADNSPLVVLESLACATPVVSFDVGGVGEMVRHQHTGLLASPGDVAGLAGLLGSLVEDRELHDQLAENARDMVMSEFTYKLAAERHRQFYERLLEDDRVWP